MKSSTAITLKTEQSFNQKLDQSLKILQAPALELSKFINQEIAKNPILEISQNSADNTNSNVHDNIQNIADDFENPTENPYTTYKDFYQYESNPRNIQDAQKYNSFILNNIKSNEDIFHKLYQQLRLNENDKKILACAQILINNLDENGFLNEDIISFSQKYGLNPKKWLQALGKIKQLTINDSGPLAIGSKNPRECLINQIKIKNKNSNSRLLEIQEIILTKYFKELAQKKFPLIAEKLNISEKLVSIAFKEIKKLNPKPLANSTYSKNILLPDKPEIEIYPNPEAPEKYSVKYYDKHIPKIQLNQDYIQLKYDPNNQNKKLTKYINSMTKNGENFINLIDKRKNTLIEICRIIINTQKKFLDNGKKHLTPLQMNSLAKKLNLNESSISRAVANKFVKTPHGNLPLRFFFSHQNKKTYNPNSNKEIIANTSIKEIIKEIIANENKKKPLSDQKITSILKEKNINISRRTVAKYRDQLNILPTTLRKITK